MLRDVAIVFTGLVGVPVVNFVDFVPVHVRVTRH